MTEPQAATRRIALPVLAAALAVCAAVPAAAAKAPKAPPIVLDTGHVAPSGAFSLQTPAGWTSVTKGTQPEIMDITGGGGRVRIVYQRGEQGYDSLHATCMLERLLPNADTSPQISYEYDFVSSDLGEQRALDSVFNVRYDEPVDGHKKWRQRNITVVGAGASVCLISFMPDAAAKKGRERAVFDAVLASVVLR